jgi:multidrug efflux pump subunit AcrB
MDDGLIHFTVISNKYHSIIEGILRSKQQRVTAIIIAIAFAVFAYFLVPLGLVHNEFFPKSNSDYIFMTLTLPPGTNSQTATNYAKQILAEIKNTPATEFVTADVGQSFNAGGGATTAAGDSNSILFSFVLFPHQQRSIASADIADRLRKQFASFSAGKITVQEESGGPPAGSDIQIKLSGDDLTVLNQYADKVEQFLGKTPGAVNIDKSIQPGTSKLVFVPDQAKVADAGLTTDQLGFWLRLFGSGFSTDSVKFDNQMTDKEDITVRLQPLSENPEALNSLSIPVQKNGVTTNVNLSSLGNLKMENNPTTITREGGQRTISVTADLAKGYNSTIINQKLETYANSGLQLPAGYSWATGGVNEENNNSVTSILLAMILSFALIMITMVLQFASFRRALIVMLVIPLSISGVFIVFGLTNTPLSFPALIGLLALFGIVVKNSILIVDKIVQNQKMGIAFIPAIADASSSRLEAIALTSVATIIGLVPISLSDPTWRGLGGAIIAGLLFSGTIMLFVIPVVYYYWFREEKK